MPRVWTAVNSQSPRERAESVASSGRVKLHIFEPSMRHVMTVVGRSSEHWVDLSLRFCSCKAFYFAMTRGVLPNCYHLKSARIAHAAGSVDVVRFVDDEFDGIIRGLVREM